MIRIHQGILFATICKEKNANVQLIIEDGVTSIGQMAFQLTKIVIPKNVKTIGICPIHNVDPLYCYPYDSNDDLEILIGDVAIIENSANTDKTGTLKALKRGKTTITVRSRWNPDVCMEYSIMIKDETGEGLYGDANGDGEVNSKDAVLIKKYLAGYEGLNIDMDAADVNVDGNIDSKDVVRLLRYLAGYQVTLGK